MTWSPHDECHAMPAAVPNTNREWDGEWEYFGEGKHVTINPKFQIRSRGGVQGGPRDG